MSVAITIEWGALCKLEPGLAVLERQARRTRFSWRAYETMKRRLARLVGWQARCPKLRNSEAYHVAHRRILRALESRKGRCR